MNELISILGVETRLTPVSRNELKGLNADLLLRFAYYTAVFNNQSLYIIEAKNAETITPLKYRRITEQIQEVTGLPVAVKLTSLPYSERQRFINQGVYFIVSDKYAFLPTIIANVRAKHKRKDKTYLIPPAQYLLLYYLQNTTDRCFTIRSLESLLPYNYLSISRAVVNLEELKLCKVTIDKSGTKTITFEPDKRRLWENSGKYLSTPVKKTFYCDTLPQNELVISGINALSHYSRLNPEDGDTLAIWEPDWRLLNFEHNEYEGTHRIEVWKYPPNMSGEKVADKLSLYLSLKGNPDARVEKELELLIENMAW